MEGEGTGEREEEGRGVEGGKRSGYIQCFPEITWQHKYTVSQKHVNFEMIQYS